MGDPANSLAVVMYHHVFGERGVPFPGLKGLPLAIFRAQLENFRANYSIVSLDDCFAAVQGTPLPPKSVLLTFDDGYREHYRVVMPLLIEYGIAAVFFPTAAPVTTKRLIDVNKIHCLLATQPDTAILIRKVFSALDAARGQHALPPLPSNDELYAQLARPFRFDNAETIFLKRSLQREIPQPLRSKLVDALFREFVSQDEAGIAEDLYLTRGELREIASSGMAIGNHGWSHDWLSTMDSQAQSDEIDKGLRLLDELSLPTEQWAFSYPYGGYNQTTLDLLESKGCTLAFTTEPATAQFPAENRLLIPRWDTLDFAKA